MERQKIYQEQFHFIQGSVLALQISGIWKFLKKYGNRCFPLPGEFIGSTLYPLHYNESMTFRQNCSDIQDRGTAMKALVGVY